MRSLILLAALVMPLYAQGSVDVPPYAKNGDAPGMGNRVAGVLYDAGGVWVTDFHLESGLIVTVPHDPLFAGVTFLTMPPGAPVVVSDGMLGQLFEDYDDWGLPVIVGSGQCWMVPYGPPNPDGSWPMQPEYQKFTGVGESLEQALMDYKSQVSAAMDAGAVPSPGSC